MKRVCLIATASGNGKTTVGRELAQRLRVPFYELDALYHGPGWTPASADELRAKVEPIVAAEAWVVDGTYRGTIGDVVPAAADVVVWLDLPLHVWLPRLLRRTARRVIHKEELWNGNRERWQDALHPTNSVVLYALRNYRKTRRALASELAPFPVARLRTQAEVDGFLSRAARVTWLGDPRGRAQAEPDRRQEHVEDEVAEDEQEPPEREPREGDPALLAQVARAPGRAVPRAAERRLARCAVRTRLVAHARAVAARLRFSTRRMIRIAVSSTESSETSITGQPSRRWSAPASSSSA